MEKAQDRVQRRVLVNTIMGVYPKFLGWPGARTASGTAL
jgi:hypothetical protein